MFNLKRFCQSRWPLLVWFVAVFLIISSLTRLALIILHFSEISSALIFIPVSLLIGVVFDLYVALYVTLPLALILVFLPIRWRTSWLIRWPVMLASWLFTFGLLYLSVTEIYFFDEFNSRLNYIAVDYLIYPHEVFVNLWETYPVLSVMIITIVLALAVTWFSRKKIREGLAYPCAFKARAGIVVGYLALIALGYMGLNIDTTRVSENRALNEIAGNGLYSFVYAGLTNELDYNQYYARINTDQAGRRLRELLKEDNATFLESDSANSIDRRVTTDNPLRRFNIVLILEESFGSNFVGRLHPEGKCLTPNFDELSAEHGTLFTHIYATGNRTVRGIEAALASYPPIPGRSIVKRPGSEQVFTLPSLLKEMGYNTIFIYGGLSYFDNVGPFAENNGYDRVFDELDFKDPQFKTIWGVCDEDLFNKALVEFDSLHTLNTPFFATLLTVSNHTPYTYPAGRIPFDPEERRRENAVRYADFSFGKFIRDAESHAFYDSTLFVFVADHGARVYGSEQIPMESYEIPLLFYNPILYPEGVTDDVHGSQMDIAPTILDCLGIDYNSEFFGLSLLSPTLTNRPILMSHNRDVSLMRADSIAILGIQGNRDLAIIDSTTGQFRQLGNTPDSSLVIDAISYYMTAYNMFSEHDLHPLKQDEIFTR